MRPTANQWRWLAYNHYPYLKSLPKNITKAELSVIISEYKYGNILKGINGKK